MSKTAVSKKIAFISTMTGAPWGGSEFLWQNAALRLVADGHAVMANVCRWPKPAAQLSALRKAGVVVNERWMTPDKLRPRSVRKLIRSTLDPLFRRAYHQKFVRWLVQEKPDLICVSVGWMGDDQTLTRWCLDSGMPYAVLVQSNAEQTWPDDADAGRLIEIFQRAQRLFFVAERNRTLLETQLGIEFTNAEVVRNPFNVRRDAAPPWPRMLEPVRLACAGRLDPEAKGQDLLLQVLASEPWRSRPVTISFFGRGHSEEGLRRLARRLRLNERVKFCGHVNDIEDVWTNNHALVLPSRLEGLPLAVVEAMHCGRPAVVTDVAGNTEIVEDGVTGFVAEAPTVKHLNVAMERAWTNRHNWESMGRAAAVAIRKVIPADPGAVFAEKLLNLAGSKKHSTF